MTPTVAYACGSPNTLSSDLRPDIQLVEDNCSVCGQRIIYSKNGRRKYEAIVRADIPGCQIVLTCIDCGFSDLADDGAVLLTPPATNRHQRRANRKNN